MKLEVGKYYRTRDGRKAGPVKDYFGCLSAVVEEDPGSGLTGRLFLFNGVHKYKEAKFDLVAEWEEETTMDNKITMDGKYAYRKDPFTQVRVLCVDRNNLALPIVSLGNNKDELVQHSPDGAAWEGRSYDLVPLQVKLPDLWGIVFHDGSIEPCYTKEEAERYQKSCTGPTKIVHYIPAPDQTA